MELDWDLLCEGCEFRELSYPDINTGDCGWYCNRREFDENCPRSDRIAKEAARVKRIHKK